jgi:hypothetical protein
MLFRHHVLSIPMVFLASPPLAWHYSGNDKNQWIPLFCHTSLTDQWWWDPRSTNLPPLSIMSKCFYLTLLPQTCRIKLAPMVGATVILASCLLDPLRYHGPKPRLLWHYRHKGGSKWFWGFRIKVPQTGQLHCMCKVLVTSSYHDHVCVHVWCVGGGTCRLLQALGVLTLVWLMYVCRWSTFCDNVVNLWDVVSFAVFLVVLELLVLVSRIETLGLTFRGCT